MMENEEDHLGLPPLSQRYAILAALENEFDLVAEQLRDQLSCEYLLVSFAQDVSMTDFIGINNLRLMAARLYLQNIYFLDDSPSLLRKSGILKAYVTATTLISQVIAEDRASEMLSFAPLSTFRLLFMSALVLWKVMTSSYHVDVDAASGKVLFNTAAFVIRQVSVQDEDLPVRAAITLNMMGRVSEKDPSLRQYEPTLQFKSRMGASIIYDCLNVAKKYRIAQTTTALESTNEAGMRASIPYSQIPPTDAQLWSIPQFGSFEQTVAPVSDNLGIESWENLPYVDWIWNYDAFPGLPDFSGG